MKPQVAPIPEFFDLMADLAEDRLSSERAARLEELLWADEANRQHYIDYMLMVTGLHRTKSDGSNDECGMTNDERQESPSGEWRVESGELSIPHSRSNPEFPVNGPFVPHSSFLTAPPLPSSYIGGILFSYVTALLVVCVGLTIAWAWKLPAPAQIAVRSVANPSSPAPGASSRIEFVGRITGMVDCQWADANTAVPGPVAVPLGRKYALSSGLMEITYDSGAKVILQGPCTYEVESAAGGYLSLGKVTARVEKGPRFKVQGSTTPSLNLEPLTLNLPSSPQSLIPNPSLSTIHYPLFTITTPSATVADLGTEFGVEVSRNGDTASYVFHGSVMIQAASADGKPAGVAQVLHENESARTVRNNDKCELMLTPASVASNFIRKMPGRMITTFDLADVVAGGSGFSGRRNAGIDPTSGRLADRRNDPTKIEDFFVSDGRYHRVERLPFVDGVFIPSGRGNPVQIDSVGDTFDAFGAATDFAPSQIWVLDETLNANLRTDMSGGEQESSDHGVLCLHANNGITFDLDAIRRANPGYRVLRFRAVTDNAETAPDSFGRVSADVWVLVDGQTRFKRREINGHSGAQPVVIPIADNERFLTLAGTDGGNGIFWDWIVFGDPRLELLPTAAIPRKNP